MTNVEQYINNGLIRPCLLNKTRSTPSIDCSNLNIPKKISEYLLLENFLSEYNTDLEKALVMLNILLLDEIPTEGSTKLVNSNTVFKIMRENKELIDLLTTLINNLQKNKSDKLDTYDKKYIDNLLSYIINSKANKIDTYNKEEVNRLIPKNISELNNNVGYLTEHLDISQKANKSEVYSKNEIDDIIANLQQHGIDLTKYYTKELIEQILNSELNEKADLSRLSSVAISGSYNDLTDLPTIPSSISELNNDSNFISETNIKTVNGESILGKGNIGFKQVVLTQSLYDSLTEYDSNTLYFIRDNSSKTFGSKFPIKF